MSYNIDISVRAKSDLREIYEYISVNLESPQNAASVIERLEKAIAGLNSMPMRFRQYETEPWKTRGMRIMNVGNFVVLYIPNEESGTVTILRVMYGGRDIDSEMQGEQSE